MRRALSTKLLLGALAGSAALAGCGGGGSSATESTRSPTVTIGHTSASSTGSRGALQQRQSAAKLMTEEEMREYDGNEGRCHDDGGSVRDVGTVSAYCAFAKRSDDFALIESSQQRRPSGEEE